MASNVEFSLSLESLPIGTIGQLFMKVSSQTIFPNIINSNPICTVDSDQYSCTLSEVFGEQILKINSAPVGRKADSSPLLVNIRTINNPPYNSTFVN